MSRPKAIMPDPDLKEFLEVAYMYLHENDWHKPLPYININYLCRRTINQLLPFYGFRCMDERELRDWECMVTNEDLDCVLNYYDWGTINEDVNEMLHDRCDLSEAIIYWSDVDCILEVEWEGETKEIMHCKDLMEHLTVGVSKVTQIHRGIIFEKHKYRVGLYSRV